MNEYGAAPEELAIAPASMVVDRIKAAVDARRDAAFVVIARCDSRPKESLDQVCQRLAAYAAAGADAVGVQLTDVADFRQIGANVATPIVTLWPKAQMSAFGIFPPRISHRADTIEHSSRRRNAARDMLIEMNRQGNDRDYFARQKDLSRDGSWYKKLGAAIEQ